MSKRKSYIGERFGRLAVLEVQGLDAHHHRLLLVRCDCGVTKQVLANSLISQRVKSCGCLRNEQAGQRTWRHGDICKGPDGKWRQPAEYRIWAGIKTRCTNPHTKCWKHYGGRGITVCTRWLEYQNFLADMGRRPGPGYSIDRIDNNGNYEPGNCRWATQSEQVRNQRKRGPEWQVANLEKLKRMRAKWRAMRARQLELL